MRFKELILKACGKALGKGQCQYVHNNKPCCVVGQAAYLRGVPIQTMKKWDNNGGVSVQNLSKSLPFTYNQIEVLADLQNAWDNNIYITRSKLKKLAIKSMKEHKTR